MTTIIRTENLTKIYNNHLKATALSGIDIEMKQGEFVVIAGPSGSGKSTLLHILGGLDIPTGGVVFIGGQKLSDMSKSKLSDFRLKMLGFIFQSYNLIAVLTVEENVEFALILQGIRKGERKEKVRSILKELAMEPYVNRRPTELSGGQQQRAAIARAIVNKPQIILADEPTANLDSQNTEVIIDLMRKMNQEHNTTFVIASHDPIVISKADHVIKIRDGKIVL